MPRGNIKNLVPNSALTPEERRARASKAGKASAEAKKRKKMFTEAAVALLETKITNPKMIAQLEAMGMDLKNATYKDMATIGMLKAAMNGNVSAFEKLQELTGEKDVSETAEIMAKLDDVLARVCDD